MPELTTALLSVIVVIELSQLPWVYLIDNRSRRNNKKLNIVLASKGVDPDEIPTYDFNDSDD